MKVHGIKKNKCFVTGLQGVCSSVVTENTSGMSQLFFVDGPENNTLYVFKELSGGAFGLLPTDPTPDFHFKITLQNSEGFIGTLATMVSFYTTSVHESGGTELTIKWDDPAFDPTAGYTVIHMHIWHDGINWCGQIDGYE